jgi:hypothetical protein
VSKPRQSRRAGRQALGLAVGGVMMLFGGIAAPAAALPFPPLKPPVKPPVKVVEVRPPTTANLDQFGSLSKYGTDDPTIARTLDEAGEGLVGDLDATAEPLAAKAEARNKIKECGGKALSGAGESYAADVRDAVVAREALPSPDFTEVTAATQECLQRYFPNAPPELLDTAKTLADEAAQRAQEARTTTRSAAALSNWMGATGADLSSGVDPGPDPRTDDSWFPWWVLGGTLLAGGGAALVVRTKRQR